MENSIVNPSATISTNTLTVGRTDDPITTITITPTLSQPVKLECQRTDAFKDWFTGDPSSRVTPTEGMISTKSGNYRTLLISSFQPIHATTYSCVVDHKSNMSTVYPVVLGTHYILLHVHIYTLIKCFRYILTKLLTLYYTVTPCIQYE